MSINFEELDFQNTPIGDLFLRRRRMPSFGDLDIYEVKLGDDYLMTSLFHESEDQVSKLGLAEVKADNWDVLVGGLGLGYTAAVALEDKRISSLIIVEYLEAVIGWHKNKLVPMAEQIIEDKRCQIIQGDFFALSKNIEKGFDQANPNRKFDAILLDIDHTPTNVLSQTNKHFYTKEGLEELSTHLKAGGIFSLWADGKPEETFVNHLAEVFKSATSHLIEFDNPITGSKSVGTVYISKKEE